MTHLLKLLHPIDLDYKEKKRKSVNIFLSISCNMFWVLKRTVSLRRFFEYPQHMFWLRNKKNIFFLSTGLASTCHVKNNDQQCFDLPYSSSCTILHMSTANIHTTLNYLVIFTCQLPHTFILAMTTTMTTNALNCLIHLFTSRRNNNDSNNNDAQYFELLILALFLPWQQQ